jgi:putative ABC transport system permease protein
MSGWRRSTLLDGVTQDLKVALRSLVRQPGFTLAALATLGVGIGANVAMFGVANLALFRPLPYRNADELVLGRTSWPGRGIGWTVSAPDYYDVRDQARSFQSFGALTPFTYDVTLTGTGEAERVSLAWISPGLFRTLGVRPLLGREFLPAEGEPDGEPVAVLSYGFWQRRLGGRPDVLGSAVVLNGSSMTVVGVMPPGFTFRTEAELWIPMVRGEAFASLRQYHNWLVVARLAPGVPASTAQADVGTIMARLAQEYPETNKGMGMVITPLRETMVESFRPSLLMFMGAVALVLLIACGNVASLLLARASARTSEMAVRSALGANRWRLVRQLLTESLVLGVGAGVLGTAVAVVVQRSLVAATPLTRMGLDTVGIQPAVLVFALGLSLATVLVFGVAPALATSRVDLSESLKSVTRAVAGRRGAFRSGLVVAQVALTVVLLVGAGLLMRSFAQLRGVDPGFDSHGLLTAEVSLPRRTYADSAMRSGFFDAYLARARAVPGVTAVAMTSGLPFLNQGGNVGAWDAAHPPVDASEVRLAYQRTVKPGYFATMGIPIRDGRDVEPTDGPNTPPVMLVNETMARTLFPDGAPLGREVAVDEGEEGGTRYRVVGVVGDVRANGPASAAPMVMYFSYEQRPEYTMRLVARSAQPAALVRPLRAALAAMDPEIPLANVQTMDQVLSGSVSDTRTVLRVIGAFAGVALLLAALGLYGVLAYFVTRRSREIGIRVALGAGAREVFGLVLRRGFALVGLGLALGVAGALLATRLVRSFLFEVRATDPATYVGVGVFFALVALVACLVPAWRAWRVDPVTTFRTE